jgi:outer membrane protein insertion porin family
MERPIDRRVVSIFFHHRYLEDIPACIGSVRNYLLIDFSRSSFPRFAGQQDLIVGIMIHGNRRIPADTIKARIFTKVGDVYDNAAIERDFNALWNTGYFEDIRFEREQSPKGWILHIYVKERPTIREINYTGLNAVSTSDVLDRFKERKVGLSVESQYDPTKIKKAEVVLKELLSEHGRQFATIRTEIRPSRPPPSASPSSSRRAQGQGWAHPLPGQQTHQ